MTKLWDFFVDTLMAFFLPLVCSYFAFSGSLFFNGAYEKAVGLEAVADVFLAPSQYLFLGQTMHENGLTEPRFSYDKNFGVKTAASIVAVVPGFVIGSTLKAVAALDPAVRHRFSMKPVSVKQTYQLETGPEGHFVSQGHSRRPGDERHMHIEKEALREIGALLDKAGIPWWVDCGTCLGAFRYGGVIPWDEDLDVAVLRADFDRVQQALSALDPVQYMVQDWSTRSKPKSYMKVFVRKTGKLIDIYGFEMLSASNELRYVLAIDDCWFFPEWLKIRERRFTAPVAMSTVFPLQQASFDGVPVYMPRDPVKYLQRYYGDNLAPAKVFDAVTGQYEKDLSHPYWQRAYVH